MIKVKGFALRNGIFFILFCCSQATMADTSVDYSAVDVGALQSQYQRQLKPKTQTKVAFKKPTKRVQIKNNELLQYQRLLAGQPARQKIRQAVNQPAKQAQRLIPTRVVTPAAPAPRPVNKPAPRRDAIFEAASVGNVRLIGQLISQGVNVNQANPERETALHMAAAKGHYSAVIYLLNHGANINARTINNWLPIHHATRFRHAQIANYLKQRGSPIHAKTADGLSAVDMAKALNDHRILGIFGIR